MLSNPRSRFRLAVVPVVDVLARGPAITEAMHRVGAEWDPASGWQRLPWVSPGRWSGFLDI